MSDDEAFLAAEKTVRGELRWTTRPNDTAVGHAVVAIGAIDSGEIRVIVLATVERRWMLVLKSGTRTVLEWDFVPDGEVRRHWNAPPRPDGFPAEDRSPIHEHVWHHGAKLSRPIDGQDDSSLRQAFYSFCERATISAGESFREPPQTQLQLER